MRKFIVSAVIIGVFVIYSLLHARSGTLGAPATAVNRPGTSTTPSATAPDGATATGTATGTASSGYKDGAYTGTVADAQWGYVQVKAVISGGRITDVQFVQYPNDRQRSIYINSYADPQLSQEAVQAQSAQVDIVTGATDTSVAFMESLSDALRQAQA